MITNEDSGDSPVINVERSINQNLVDDYIDCDGTRRLKHNRGRLMRDLDQVNNTVYTPNVFIPIGVSSLPSDESSNEVDCLSPNAGETCTVMNGALTLLYEKDAEFSGYYSQEDVLKYLQQNMASIKNITGVVGIEYLGTMAYGTLNDIGVIVSNANLSEIIPLDDGPVLTLVGYGIVACVGALIIVAGLLTMRKIRSNAYNRNDEVLMSELDCEFSEEVLDASAIRQGRRRLSSNASSEAQDMVDSFDISHHKARNIPLDNTSKGSDESGQSHEFEGIDESSQLYELVGLEESNQLHNISIQDGTQQVCLCTSATCDLCRQNNVKNSVKFIGVDAEDGGIEVDVTFQNNHSYAGMGGRLFETPDTVQL